MEDSHSLVAGSYTQRSDAILNCYYVSRWENYRVFLYNISPPHLSKAMKKEITSYVDFNLQMVGIGGGTNLFKEIDQVKKVMSIENYNACLLKS
mgnify:CR=1 FL=1